MEDWVPRVDSKRLRREGVGSGGRDKSTHSLSLTDSDGLITVTELGGGGRVLEHLTLGAGMDNGINDDRVVASSSKLPDSLPEKGTKTRSTNESASLSAKALHWSTRGTSRSKSSIVGFLSHGFEGGHKGLVIFDGLNSCFQLLGLGLWSHL